MNRILFSFMLLFPLAVLAQQRNGRGLKVPPRDTALQEFMEVFLEKAPVKTYPPSFDVSSKLPPPGNQGRQESCVAWATCYGLMSFLQGQLKPWLLRDDKDNPILSHVYSPAYLYNRLHSQPDLNCDSGLYFSDAIKQLDTAGTVTWNLFAYDTNSCGKTPGDDLRPYRATLINPIKLFDHWATTPGAVIDTNQVKRVLNAGYPVAIGVFIDHTWNDMYSKQPPPKPVIWKNASSKDSTYHAVVCVGYNDALKAFRIMNSWGKEFGNQGYLWISYNVFLKRTMEAYYVAIPPAGFQGFDNLLQDTTGPNDIGSLSPGFFHRVNRYTVSCLYADKGSQTAIVQIKDTITGKSTNVPLSTRKDKKTRSFLHNGEIIQLSLEGIKGLDNFGKNSAAQIHVEVKPG